MPEWFHILVQRVDGKWLDRINVLNKGHVKSIVRDYNNGKTIYIKSMHLERRHIVNLSIFRTFTGLHNPAIEDILKTEDVTGDFKVKSSEEVISILRNKKKQIKITKTDRDVDKQRKVTLQSNKIFIVHGHDKAVRDELFVLLTSMGLEPIVLNEEPDDGMTIIEKLEYHSSDVGYAVVLLTPDDYGGTDINSLKPRARQNVILELGYFMGYFTVTHGLVGRKRVLCLIKGDKTEPPMEKPSDILGIVIHQFRESVEKECSKVLYRNLISAGYKEYLK